MTSKKLFLTALLSTFTLFSLSAQVDLETGLIAYYPFNGSSLDESGNGNHAFDTSGTELVPDCDGEENNAYSFSGVNSYMAFPHNELINFDNDDEFAISMWINIPEEQANIAGTVNDILVKWNNQGPTPYPFNLRVYNQTHDTNEGKLNFARYDSNSGGCNGSSFMISSMPLNDNKWHNVIFQLDANGMFELYIDGVLDASVIDNSICSISNTNNLLLGSRTINPTFREFKGAIDEFRIYNRTLTADEITAIANKEITSVNELRIKEEKLIFPNPVQEVFFIQEEVHLTNAQSIQIYDVTGQLVAALPISRRVELPRGISTGTFIVAIVYPEQILTDILVVIE